MVMVADEPDVNVKYFTSQLGAEMRRLMQREGINGLQLAEMTGIRNTKMNRILTGQRVTMLTPPELGAIASALNTSQAHLLNAAGFDLEVHA